MILNRKQNKWQQQQIYHILTTASDNIVNRQCRRVQSGHAQVNAWNRRPRTNLDTHWLRDIEQQKCYYESSTHIFIYICFVDDTYWFAEICSASDTSSFVLRHFLRPARAQLCSRFFASIFRHFVHLLDDICFSDSHTLARTHHPYGRNGMPGNKIYDYLEKVHFNTFPIWIPPTSWFKHLNIWRGSG